MTNIKRVFDHINALLKECYIEIDYVVFINFEIKWIDIDL